MKPELKEALKVASWCKASAPMPPIMPDSVEGNGRWLTRDEAMQHLVTVADALREATEPRPMSSAPKDGTHFLIFVEVGGTGEIKVWDTVWNEGGENFECIEPDDILLRWLPLPVWPKGASPRKEGDD